MVDIEIGFEFVFDELPTLNPNWPSAQTTIITDLTMQFGAELVKLYKSDDESEFLGKHVESEKCIYQQGSLRKLLSTAALELGAIKMTIPERDSILLSQAIASCIMLMPPSMKSSTRVTISVAIYGSGGLINIGDFVLYKSANSSSVI
ncbi:hypothetical protein EMCRGX_G031258 [Ephydatia muelleri]